MSRLVEAEAFALVVASGSFTAAAKRLGVGKSYASKLVSQLEDRLGVRLLQRSTRKLALTEAGRIYFDRCQEVLTAFNEVEVEVAQLQAAVRGRLRVTLPAAFGALYLTRPLAEFGRLHPDLTVEAIFSDERMDLLGEGFDVAIRAGELPDSAMVSRLLVRGHRVLCASDAYLERKGVPGKPEELAQHECLRYAYHSAPCTWQLEGRRGRRVPVRVTGALVSNHVQMLVEAACAGQGVLNAPIFFAAPALRDGRLRPLLRDWWSPANVYALLPQTRHVPANVRAFVDFFVEQLRDPPWSDWEQSAST